MNNTDIKLVMEMMALPGPSGGEGKIADFIRNRLERAGADMSTVASDQAHRRSHLRGETGNLVFRLPGTIRGARRLLVAHMDTVPICVGSRPVREGNTIRSTDPATGLGADDRAGAAILLRTAIGLIRKRPAHPPVTFLWTVQEEVGLQGAHYLRLGLLGRPRLAFNFDGGAPEKLTIGATGGYRMEIGIEGIASHAGGAPEWGVSAISIAARAIARLDEEGWHGLVVRGRSTGTSNVGVIAGGKATNVVPDQVVLKAEARSHDPRFRAKIVRAIEKAFRDAARRCTNCEGRRGRVSFDGQIDYEAFQLSPDDPSLLEAESALRSEGLEPIRAIANGGLDANWLTARGIPTVSLGCGQGNIHTTDETLDVEAFATACRVAERLACG
ncbi:MAG: M20/M25/M40 family metallo-hydrolase [Pirellulales bacterium]